MVHGSTGDRPVTSPQPGALVMELSTAIRSSRALMVWSHRGDPRASATARAAAPKSGPTAIRSAMMTEQTQVFPVITAPRNSVITTGLPGVLTGELR